MSTRTVKSDAFTFCQGWRHGRNVGAASAGEALEAYPMLDTIEVNLFLNGNDDGVKNDRRRYDPLSRVACDPPSTPYK